MASCWSDRMSKRGPICWRPQKETRTPECGRYLRHWRTTHSLKILGVQGLRVSWVISFQVNCCIFYHEGSTMPSRLPQDLGATKSVPRNTALSFRVSEMKGCLFWMRPRARKDSVAGPGWSHLGCSPLGGAESTWGEEGRQGRRGKWMGQKSEVRAFSGLLKNIFIL